MLRFYRTLRRRLLAETRARKYVLYGIGEILLVMIGAWPALHVNIWNEDRKSRTVEWARLPKTFVTPTPLLCARSPGSPFR